MLCSLAFTQPLLSALQRQSVYLHDQQFSWVEIGALLLMLMVVVPTSCVALDLFVQCLSRLLHGWGRNTVFAILFSLVLLSFVRPYCSTWWFVMQGSSGLVVLAAVIPCSWWLARLYERMPVLRSWMTLTSVGLVFFPGMFLWQIHHRPVDDNALNGRIEAKNPVPVIFVVFDEFSGTTLMNERMEMDELRFPQFARLARYSTWYRNATTVSPRTDIAVPAILSGRYPVTQLPPLAASYPGNLLQLIEATEAFEMAVFEPVTRLCPTSIAAAPPPKRPQVEKSIDLILTLAAVYPRLIFTTDTPVWFPTIPQAWFSVRLGSTFEAKQSEVSNKGLFYYAGTENRRQQQQHVLNCLNPSEPPGFCFFHTVLPHYPWSFLPSGEQYQSEFAAPSIPSGARGELGEDWDNDVATVLRNEFRYRLQVGYIDRFIGELLDRLAATGLLDRCLLIVTADHGVAFRPGHSRRVPDAETLPDIFSVPLFIKYLGQSRGETDDRNIESIDLLPTVADVLKLELPEPVDGIPISSEMRRARKTLYFGKTATVVEPDFPGRFSSVQRQYAVFGNGRLDQPPAAIASHPEWHGRAISSFLIDERTIPAELFDLQNREIELDTGIREVLEPRLITGTFAADELPAIPAEIVVAVDGIIRDTGKSYWIHGSEHGFQFLVPKSVVQGPMGSVELYVVDSTKSYSRFRRLKITNAAKPEERF